MTLRFRWVTDEDYRSAGSYSFDTEDETNAAVQAEIDGLNDGSLEGPYGCICEKQCPCCQSWVEVGSLWGIILAGGDPTNYRAEVERDLAQPYSDDVLR